MDDEWEIAWPVDDGFSDDMCDGCTCCTWHGCIPANCGEDDYGRFHCPCTSE
jgi:hypothetical protein